MEYLIAEKAETAGTYNLKDATGNVIFYGVVCVPIEDISTKEDEKLSVDEIIELRKSGLSSSEIMTLRKEGVL